MEFSDGSHNTKIPNIGPLSGTNYPASNDEIYREIQNINKNLTTLINDIKEILNCLKGHWDNSTTT